MTYNLMSSNYKLIAKLPPAKDMTEALEHAKVWLNNHRDVDGTLFYIATVKR